MAPRPPDAFLSYTRFDDRRGDISAFRKHLEHAVQEVTGAPFKIFQDVDDIEIGERWSDKLDQILDEARFFIPIVTPSYFTSKPCRDELEKFFRAEADHGRRDLVLPIYYIDSDTLENTHLRAADPLAAAIHKRQRHDWRPLRFSSFSTKTVRTAFYKLAREIARARRRSMPRESAIYSAAPVALTSERSTVLRRSTQHDLEVQDKLALADHAVTFSPETLRPGTVFRDIDEPWCPELVVIPPGEFMMGSSEAERQWAIEHGAEAQWLEAEKPPHLVRIAYSLAVGRFPVTFEEYGQFAHTTGRKQPRDEGWGGGRRPVIDIEWEDAKALVAWLSAQTSQRYRLLSEAEWEYGCRAGTSTYFSWGNDISPENANYEGSKVGKTCEVGSYPANPWGLYDMHGNVWEWVEDCGNETYEGAPDDGSAWTSGDRRSRVSRGGSWFNAPWLLRSAFRFVEGGGIRFLGVSMDGFRVARELSE